MDDELDFIIRILNRKDNQNHINNPQNNNLQDKIRESSDLVFDFKKVEGENIEKADEVAQIKKKKIVIKKTPSINQNILEFEKKASGTNFAKNFQQKNDNLEIWLENKEASKTGSRFLKNFYNNLNKIRYLNFRPYIDSLDKSDYTNKDSGYYYKLAGNDTPLIRLTLQDNGFIETKENDWILYWSSGSVKQNIFTSLNQFQKVNHFPRTSEITRKDLLYKNLSKMKSNFNHIKSFDFFPESYVLPGDYAFLEETISKDPTQIWIVKPVASSQGRGIFVTNRLQDIQIGSNVIVSKYIWNPLLIGGLKFDLRIYVLLTSVLPLRIYIYEEGLTRFATEKYFIGQPFQASKYMHLTNYSVNKISKNFVKNHDPGIDNHGNKWSLIALKNFLEKNGVDFQTIFEKIEDIAIKTILSVENVLVNGYVSNIPWKNSCFELFGFDILIDSFLNPWLLEVNLSPSLNCDSPLDQKIKGELVSEIFNMLRLIPFDLREKEQHYIKNMNCDIDEQIIKDCMKIDIMKDFKLSKEIKEMIWSTEEECSRYMNS